MISTRRIIIPVWTITFITVSILCFVFQQVSGLWVYLAFFPAYVERFPWMFVTSIFLHVSIQHLVFNMIALYFFGSSLERIVGGKIYVLLFFLSGIVGNFVYMITAFNPRIPALGASGAIYGITGSLAVLAPFMMVFVYGILPVPMVAATFLWALTDFLGLFAPSGVAHGAHLGGMLVGVAFGIYIRLRMKWLTRFIR
ncbi:MAG: rhomboid family intramembrane serine protease [Candidatus Bathyarchaeia archaeon]